MRYRTLPGTTLSVSELSFGNFIYGSHMWGKTPADAPEGVLDVVANYTAFRDLLVRTNGGPR